MIYYTINKPELRQMIHREISSVADSLHAKGTDGSDMYDSIIDKDKDRPAIDTDIDEALSRLVRRAYDIAVYAPLVVYQEDEQGNPTSEVSHIVNRIEFNVPDFDERNAPAALAILDEYVISYVCAEYFKLHQPALVEAYATQAATQLDTLVAFIRTRKHPITSW